MRAEAGVRPVRGVRSARLRRRPARTVRRLRRTILLTVAALAVVVLAAGVGFAGSAGRIAAGVSVAGVDVGGLTEHEARSKLRSLAASYATVPAEFTAANRRWSLRPDDVDLRFDWTTTVAHALDVGDGPVPIRGLERFRIRLFGADVRPETDLYEPGLDHRVARMADAVETPPREAAIVLSGLRPVVVPERPGHELDREAAAAAIVASLSGFDREPVALPVEVAQPEVTRRDLLPVASQVETALAAPVRLGYRGAHVTVQPAEIAHMLELPRGGATKLGVDDRAARRYFANLARGVQREPSAADFALRADGTVRVVRSRDGRRLDVRGSAEALLAAALRTRARSTNLVVAAVEPSLTTAEARALRVERRLGFYGTLYSGTADRVTNLQRAVTLLDGARVAPGATFSFNDRVGPRTEERGFRPAPVIVGGEYEDGIGGGVSQVATTLFNAAWEAGVRITARTAHALYISRYPLGRDATVNYPDIDLRFLNDTGRWIVIDAAYDESGIVIGLLGAGRERRVVSEAGELEDVARPKVERQPDATLYEGERIVVDMGEPARAVRVTRTVFQGDAVLYDETWYTSYRSEPRIVRVGTKPRPVEPPPPPEEKKKKEEDEDEEPPPPPPDG
jgi:vancomycin resistance protein YoaR